jgi:hypothetical protein
MSAEIVEHRKKRVNNTFLEAVNQLVTPALRGQFSKADQQIDRKI